MITRNFNLYLNAGHSVPLVINVNQYDQGEQWVFTLYNADGTKYTPSTGAIVGIKSDGLGIINSGSVNESGQVVISETQQMTAAVGKAVFELMIDNQTHGTANFVVLVEEKPGNNADLSESDLSLLEEAISATSPLPTGGTVGQVLTKTANGSTWSDAGTPTQEQVADAVSDWADEHITVTTGVVIDTSLSVAGAAADAKKTGDELADLKSQIANVETIPYEVKLAMDNMFAHVTYKDYDASNDYAIFRAWAGFVDLVSIDAEFTQGNRTIFADTDLNSLKDYLVVTATYSNGDTSILGGDAYVLTGQLTTGTSPITVTYENKTDTFNVTVTGLTLPEGYTQYGYIQKKSTSATNVPRAKFILLNSYDDMNSLSMEITLGQKSSTATSSGVFGARMDTANNSYSLYNNSSNNGVAINVRNKWKAGNSLIGTTKTIVKIINNATSPAYLIIGNDNPIPIEWEAPTTVISCPIMLFNNVPYDDTSANYAIHPHIRIGDIILRKADGECVGYYVPVTYNGVIGMYDFISEVFYTASNTTVMTVGNSGCLYAVGNW